MTMRALFVVGIRIVAALAFVVFTILAINRSTADVTFTFPASETDGLTQDVEFRCGSAPTSFDVSAGGVRLEGSDAYDAWALEITKETTKPPDTDEAEIAACEAARDSRVISLIWLVAGALMSAIILVGVSLVPAHERIARRTDTKWETDHDRR